MDLQPAADPLVSAAEIARLAGVTRAAVSNWRRRHADFPAAVGDGRNILFRLAEVNAWLDRQRKRGDVANETLVWQALRGEYRDDLVRGLADLADLFTGRSDGSALDSDLRGLARALLAECSPRQALEGLCDRLVDSPGAAGPHLATTRRLIRAIRHFAGPAQGVVFDPACGIGSLLLAFAGQPDLKLAGQDVNPSAVRLAQGRAALADPPGDAAAASVTFRAGDSLRADQWPQLRADLVVCDPPTNMVNWGREELLLDSRWELGVPTRAEHELAWLQHGYAHVAPGGHAIVVMPASVAYRKAGRRIRAELVRRGILTQIVALPAGMVASHAQPVHLWILRRPVPDGPAPTSLRMIDLTGNDPDGPLVPSARQVVEVPLIELLDETVDLTPARQVAASHPDHLAEYRAARQALAAAVAELLDLLPALGGGASAPDGAAARTSILDGATLRIGDLLRAGIVDLVDGQPTSTSDQLDTDYLRGFLRGGQNLARATSGSGSHRTDLRGSRIPQMELDDQRYYGAAFRALEEFDRQLRGFVRLAERASALARDGLTSGSLRPGVESRG